MLEHHAPVPVHDALRGPCGARRVHDPQWVIERQPFVSARRRRAVGEVAPRHVVARGSEDGEHDHPGERRYTLHDPPHHIAAIVGDAAVDVAVGSDQELRLDLAEAVDDRRGTEVRRADGPDRTNRCGGEERHDRLGKVGKVGRHPVAPTYPGPPQPRDRRSDELRQLAVRDGDIFAIALGATHQRREIRIAGERSFCIVERGTRKPVGWHRIGRHHRLGRREIDLEELGNRRPEAADIVDRPPP